MNIKPQYFGIAEQILLSAANMLASLVVVKVAGVSWFGIYSFIFVIATLASAFLSTLLHRQLILIIASSDSEHRRRLFLATLILQGIAMIMVGSCIAVLLHFYANTDFIQQYSNEIVSAAIYVLVFNYFDLFKQYSYVLDKQSYSFRCTVIYCVALALGLSYIWFNSVADGTVAHVYIALSVALAVSLLSNRLCQIEFSKGRWTGWKDLYAVLVSFFDQGKFRLVGMVVTWAQNQSMNPILMWLSGPLVAGLFSMARLMIMPMAVINQGLTNSTTPQLRRIYQADGAKPLQLKIASYTQLNFLLAAGYIIILVLAHMSGLLEKWVPDYVNVQVFLLIWVVTICVTMYRFWLTQYFIVCMKFRFLMRVSIISLLVSMTGMLGVGYFLENVYLALMFVIIGEAVSIAFFVRKQSTVTQ